MYVEYFHWQFVVAPHWLVRLFWNLQRAIMQEFSVSFMLKTLFAHWHKDQVSYRQGSISGMLKALAWNLISRGIGFVVRSCVLIAWLVVEVLFAVISVIALVLFILWPLLVLAGLAAGLVMVILW